MNQQVEALAAANAANVEAMHSLAYASLKATERLMSLSLGFARASLRLGADCARPTPNGDWRLMLSQQSSGFQKGAEEAASYLRSVYDISSETQAEVNEAISARVDGLSESVGSMLDAIARSAPAGSEKAVNMLKSAFAGTCSAYAQTLRVAPQGGGNGRSPKKPRRGQ
jgi:phasin family protein